MSSRQERRFLLRWRQCAFEYHRGADSKQRGRSPRRSSEHTLLQLNILYIQYSSNILLLGGKLTDLMLLARASLVTTEHHGNIFGGHISLLYKSNNGNTVTRSFSPYT